MQGGEDEYGEIVDPGCGYENGHDNKSKSICANGRDEESNKYTMGRQSFDNEIESDFGYDKDDRLYQLALKKNVPSSSSSLLSSSLNYTSTSSRTHHQSPSQSISNTEDSINRVCREEDEVSVYSSESEMISALILASTDPLYSETYQRCCKVLIKIANLNQAKHFFWEVDSVMYPDYYSSIKRPIVIANITSSLIHKSYGNDNIIVGNLFYNDLRQITLNCFAYNTEVTAINAQAQKLYQV